MICEKAIHNSLLKSTAERIIKVTNEVANYIAKYPETVEIGAREYSYSLYRILTGVYLFYFLNFLSYFKNIFQCDSKLNHRQMS